MKGCMKATTAPGQQTGVRDEGKKRNKPHFCKGQDYPELDDEAQIK
jgi:hypothetical protein